MHSKILKDMSMSMIKKMREMMNMERGGVSIRVGVNREIVIVENDM